MSENTGKASTIFAGDSSPGSGHEAKTAGAVAGLAIIIALPVALITAVAIWASFTWGRISHRVIWSVVALYAVGLIATGNAVTAITKYIESWNIISNAAQSNGDQSLESAIFEALVLQAPISILIGGIVGATYSYWRWLRRASWETFNFRLTPYQWLKKKKNISDIQSDKNSPDNGKTVGVESTYGKKIIQTDAEARAHTLVVGSTGSGKTTTLMLMARDIIKRGQGLIFVDLKGSPDVARILHEYSERYGRPFQHWIMQTPGEEYIGPDPKGPAFYDPLNRGDASRRTNLVMAGREWTEPYYEVLAQDYLQRAFEVAINTPSSNTISSFAEIAELFDVNVLRERAQLLELKGNRRYEDILRQIDQYFNKDGSVKKDDGVKNALKSVEAELRILTNSTAGAWLRKDPDGDNDINLRSVADNGAIVVFSLDSNNYESDANRIGNLIIQDLKTVTSELMHNPSDNILQVYIDEFSAIDSENIVGLINKSRAANVPVTLSTQAIDDLRRSSESFLGRVVANINSFIIHRANDFDDAEEYAKLTGKVKKKVFNQQVEHASSIFGKIGKGAGTGRGNLVEVEDYRVSPTRIQELGTGEAVYIAKSPLRFEYVTVVPEDESKIVIDEVAQKRNLTESKSTDNKPKPFQAFSSFTSETDPEWDAEEEKARPVEMNDGYLPSYEIKKPNKDNLDRILNKKNVGPGLNVDLEKKDIPSEVKAEQAKTARPSGLPQGLPTKAPSEATEAPVKPAKAPLATGLPSAPVKPSAGLPKRPGGLPARPVQNSPESVKPNKPVAKPTETVKPSPAAPNTPKGKSISGEWDD